MVEAEFFNKVKKINRFLSDDARSEIWRFIIEGEFIDAESGRMNADVVAYATELWKDLVKDYQLND